MKARKEILEKMTFPDNFLLVFLSSFIIIEKCKNIPRHDYVFHSKIVMKPCHSMYLYSSYIFCGCWVICSILCLFVKLCPYWMMEWDVIHLYGLGQSSPHELVFTAELNPISLFFTFFPWAILDQLTSYGWSRLW